MIKTLKCLCLLVALFAINRLQAQPAEADFIKLSKEYKLNADGSYDMRCYKQVKLFTHMAFNTLYGETFIVYNPQYQKLSIKQCYTIQADGKKIQAPSNSFNEVLPSFAANSPEHNQLREMVITHTGLELGATIFLDYTIHTNAGYMPALLANEVMQEQSPIKEYTVSVEYPNNVNLIYNQFNCSKPIVLNGSTNKLTWTIKNIPARLSEIMQPADRCEAPQVAFTTAPLDKIIGSLSAQFTAPNNDIKRKTAELISGKDTNKVSTLTSFVVNNIATINVPLEYTGYKLRSVNEVYRTAYGTPIEKAALLTAMLNEVGIKASAVFAFPNWAEKEQSAEGFWSTASNEFPVFVEQDGDNKYYVSPVRTEVFTWNDEGKTCYTISSNPQKLPAVMQGVNIRYTFNIAEAKKEEGKDIKLEMAKTGEYSINTTNGKINIGSEKSTTPVAMSVNNNHYTCMLPESGVGIDTWRALTLLSSLPRKTLLELPCVIDESYTYTCAIPTGMEVANTDMDLTLDKPVGKLVISFKTDKEKGVLNITRSIKLNKNIFETKDYKDVKELINAWVTTNYKTVVMRQKPQGFGLNSDIIKGLLPKEFKEMPKGMP